MLHHEQRREGSGGLLTTTLLLRVGKEKIATMPLLLLLLSLPRILAEALELPPVSEKQTQSHGRVELV